MTFTLVHIPLFHLQLTNIKSNLGRSAKLKFRGCNHPVKKQNEILQTFSSYNELTSADNRMNKERQRAASSLNNTSASYNSKYMTPNTKMIENRSSNIQLKGRPKKEEGFSHRHHNSKATISKVDKKMFSRSESLEAFPPLTKKFSKRQHSKSP